MKKFFLSLPLGVRQFLIVLVVFYIGAVLLKYFGVCDLQSWLALRSPDVWRGQIWELLTYWLLPGGIFNFAINCVFFIFLAPRLEKEWSRRELWTLCLISAVGAGLGQILLTPHSPMSLMGIWGINYGILAAWVKLFGHEKVLFFGQWPMSIRIMALVVVGFSFLLSYPQFLNVLIALCGGITAWIYLTIRWKKNLSAPASVSSSERMNRLEF